MEGILRKLSSDTEPDVVYHYTSLSSMMKILAQQRIWATNIEYLNDAMERRLLLRLVDRCFDDFGVEHSDLITDFREYGPFDSPRQRDVDEGPFVASFSAAGDSLNQWRSYCPIANGVSIGFRTESLALARITDDTKDCDEAQSIPLTVDTQFGAVQYIPPDSESHAIDALNDSLARAEHETRSKEEAEGGVPSFLFRDLFSAYIETTASFYKHVGFFHEGEYRLVLPHLLEHFELLRFRTTRSSLVPYVQLVIPSISLQNEPWNAVAELIVGPTPNAELTCKAVSAFCASIGLAIPVRPSSLPYRDW